MHYGMICAELGEADLVDYLTVDNSNQKDRAEQRLTVEEARADLVNYREDGIAKSHPF